MKRILSFIILAAILTGSVFSLSSCDKPEIFNLLEMILDNKRDNSSYNFNGEINIKINKEYLYEADILTDFEVAELDAVPDEINIKLDGNLQHNSDTQVCNASINLYLEDFNIQIFIFDGVLFFENNEITKIILDLLTAAGFIDLPVNKIFSEIVYAERGVFHADLQDFDLSWFGQYAEQTDKTFKITSTLDIKLNDTSAVMAPQLSFDLPALYFDEIKAQVEKELLKVPGYRYSELSIILSPDNYLHVLARNENGARKLLEPFKLDIELDAVIAKAAEEPGVFLMENIIPMRYMLELMGEEVDWNDSVRKPFIIREGENIYFDAVLVNSRSYINLIQILSPAGYSLSTGEIGGYLEFKIFRK